MLANSRIDLRNLWITMNFCYCFHRHPCTVAVNSSGVGSSMGNISRKNLSWRFFARISLRWRWSLLLLVCTVQTNGVRVQPDQWTGWVPSRTAPGCSWHASWLSGGSKSSRNPSSTCRTLFPSRTFNARNTYCLMQFPVAYSDRIFYAWFRTDRVTCSDSGF